MLVHEILVEVDPTLKNIVNPLSSINTSIPKFDMKPSGVLDDKGNKIYNVVDKDGKVVKTFKGPNAAGDAETFRDKQNAKIRKQGINVGGKQTNAPDANTAKIDKLDKKVDDIDKKLDKLTADDVKEIKKRESWIKKSFKFLATKPGLGLIAGLVASGYLTVQNVTAHLAHYHFYWCKNGKTTGAGPFQKEIQYHRAKINSGIFSSIMGFFTAVIAGAVTARTFSFVMGGLGLATWGTGWIAGAVTFIGSTALVLLAEKLKRQDEFWMKQAAYLGGYIVNNSTLEAITKGYGGDCIKYEDIEMPVQEQKDVVGKNVSSFMKDLIVGDPELKNAFKKGIKKAKRRKQDKQTKESGLQYYTGVKKHGKEYMKKAAQAGREGASQEELGRLKDKYSKAEKTKSKAS